MKRKANTRSVCLTLKDCHTERGKNTNRGLTMLQQRQHCCVTVFVCLFGLQKTTENFLHRSPANLEERSDDFSLLKIDTCVSVPSSSSLLWVQGLLQSFVSVAGRHWQRRISSSFRLSVFPPLLLLLLRLLLFLNAFDSLCFFFSFSLVFCSAGYPFSLTVTWTGLSIRS